MGAFSEDYVLQELAFILDDFVNFLDAKTESLDCLVEDAALFLRVWFLVCLTDIGPAFVRTLLTQYVIC